MSLERLDVLGLGAVGGASMKPELSPLDSVSQAGSRYSGTSSALAKATAKKAALQAKMQYFQKQQDLELKKFELTQKCKQLDLEAEITAAAVEEEVLSKFEDQEVSRSALRKTFAPERSSDMHTTIPYSDHIPASHSIGEPKHNSVHIDDPIDSQHLHPHSKQLNPNAPVWQAPLGSYDSHLVMQRQMLDVMSLPKATLKTFDGDPMDFWVFMNAFDCFVGCSTVTDASKLNRLFEYCTGKAAKAIKPCAMMNPFEGYLKARNLLEERFGNRYTISEAWIKKVTEGPTVRPYSGEALQELADDVRGCVETLKALKMVEEIDSRIRMLKIVERLPAYLQGRWRKEAVGMLDRIGKYPNIHNLANFLDKTSREINDPIFGSKDNFARRDKPIQKKSSSFNICAETTKEQVESMKPASSGSRQFTNNNYGRCYHCKGDHKLSSCEQFLRMSGDKRLIVVKEHRLCFNCLLGRNHTARWCRLPSDCEAKGCTLKHSKLLHVALQASMMKRTDDELNNAPKAVVASYACRTADEETQKIALPIIAVRVRAPGQECFIHTHALLDPGSNRSFCSSKLVEDLGLKSSNTSLTMKTLNAKGEISALEVALEITGAGPSSWKKKRQVIPLPRVYGIKEFPPLTSSLAVSSEVNAWNHLRGIKLPPSDDSEVTLLIGQDVPQALMPLEVRHGEQSEPYAIRTALGWTVNGPLGKLDTGVNETMCHFIHANERSPVDLEAQVEHFWKLDTEYSLVDGRKQMSVEDRSVLAVWNSSLHKDDHHYVLDIPFKLDPPGLPNNLRMAQKRLHHLALRLQKDTELHLKYTACMNDLITKGYAELVPDINIETAQGQTWYLPHHHVYNPNKPDKLRIVFDCAAEFAGTSLNKNVLQGPDLTNTLLGVLLRFREQRVAVMGDIEAMFHQVKVSPSHRDVLRFLWWVDGDLSREPLLYRMTVHLFGGVWSPSCASYALQQTMKDNLSEFDAETTTTVMDNFYADDCLKSVDTEEKACSLVQQLCELLTLGGFRLTKWVSNSRIVLESIPESERAKQVRSINFQHSILPQERALGVQWDTETDELGIKTNLKEGKLSRRGLLSVMSSVYDPMGFVSPYVLVAKKIFQAECRMDKSWDDELEITNKIKWQNWLNELPLLEAFKLNRCLIPSSLPIGARITLHTFCDASQEAYGCVSYLRVQTADGSVHCSFLLAKSKLAPMKQLTIPRLELSAAVLGVKLNSMLRREMRLGISESYFWTDSMVVLQYVKNRSKRFHTFVANRVAIIHDASTPGQWRFVESQTNVADDASRGLNAAAMISSDRWKHGPEFLWKDRSCWPVIPEGIPDLQNGDAEVKQETRSCLTVIKDSEQPFDRLLSHYSSWYKLKKAVAWLARFKNCLQHRDGQSHKTQGLQVCELQNAEKNIVTYLQKAQFGKEIQALESGSGRISRNSVIYSLEPHKGEDGLLRVGGRLQAAPIAEHSRHPVILPRDHHVSELIIREVHESGCKHSGREYVLSLVRMRYWIPRARPLINRVLRACVTCKRLRAKPEIQQMANLPQDRVTPGKPPFTYVGVDCFGPFLVKRGRSREKRYGCLFTCLVTRAVHLEKLSSMDADSFLNALVRFMSRRGTPVKIRSDNGTNFVGGEKELRNSIRAMNANPKLKEAFLHQEIEWEFNPPAASHMGGVWERQIRTVRKVLNSILHEQVLDDERLDTIFCEVESIVNGRPLTPVSDDPKDMESLTPNHLLLLRAGPAAPLGDFGKADVYGRRWRHVQFLSDLFWKRWLREYLPTLLLRQKWIEPQRNMTLGDMVLIKDENTPRKCWPLGRITKVFPSKDGLVRSVEVKTSWGHFMRPIDKLCVIQQM